MKEKISNIEIFSISLLCLLSSSIGISLYITIKIASIDSYIGIIIGTIIGIIPLLIFLLIFNYQKDKPLSEKNKHLFGKPLGNIINYIITIIFFIISSTILFNISNFIVSQYLVDTLLIYIMIILGLVIYYSLNKNIEIIARISIIFMAIFISLFIFGAVSITGKIKIDNIKPILEFGLKKPLIAGLINSLITTMPLYSLLVIPKNNITDKEKTTKYITISYIISSFIIIVISFLPNSIMGKYLINLYQYPGYATLKKISLFKFIDRIENFLSLHWILSSFTTIIMCLYNVKSNINKKNNKLLNIIICTLLIILSYKLFKNNTIFNNYLYYIYTYILLVMIIIFIIISINILIRKLLKKE